jgi:predicted MFS family arabinose efflux permease
MALNAVGLGLWALAVEPHVPYTHLLPALIVCGIGMGMFFAPSANLVMSTVRPQEQGVASGANNAIRELGGALGVATLAAVFSAQGGYESATRFVDGLIPALWVGAAAVALAAVVALLLPRHPVAGHPDAAGVAFGETPAGVPTTV